MAVATIYLTVNDDLTKKQSKIIQLTSTWPYSYGFPHAIINIVVPESRVNNYAPLGLILRRTCNFHDE